MRVNFHGTPGVSELVHTGGGKLPRADLVLKQNVQLSESAALGLRQAEVGPDHDEEAEGGPEEASLGSPVPRVEADHARHQRVVHQASHVVEVSGQDNGLSLESSGRDLSHDGVADRANRHIVDEGVEDEETADCPRGTRFARICKAEATDDDENDEKHAGSCNVERTASNPGHEEPRDDDTDCSNSILHNGKSERAVGGEAGTLVELDRVTHEHTSTSCLSDVCYGCDLSSSQIGPHEAVPVVGTRRGGLFKLVCGVDHGDLGVGIKLETGLGADKLKNSLLGICMTTLTDQPPWRLWGKESSKNDERRPDPLDGEGDTVGPFGVHVEESTEDTGRDQLTNNPAEVDIGREVWSKNDGGNIRSIGQGESLENTPRDTEQDLAGKDHLDVLGKEDDEDEGNHEHLGEDHGLLVANGIRHPAVEIETDDLAAHASDLDVCLPVRRDDLAALAIRLVSVLVSESGRMSVLCCDKWYCRVAYES